MTVAPEMRAVVQMLSSRIEALAAELFPCGKRDGSEWRVGSLAGEPGKSLSINLRGAKAGIWCDFAGGPSGDALDLVAHTLYNGNIGDAFRWALRWLGLDSGGNSPRPDRMTVPTKSADPEPDHLESARRIWGEALPARGSIVEAYLKSRGLELPNLGCFRFHPACPHGPGLRLPAMLALMTSATMQEPVGIHRTPLLPDGTGRPPNVDKKMMGKAGVIRLVPDEQVTLGLGIAEGIETALSVIQHGGWSPVWAVCTAGGMERFPVLPGALSQSTDPRSVL